MTHTYIPCLIWLWRDSCMLVTWLIRMCDMTHSYVWHDSFLWDTWILHKCDMTHSRVCHDFVRHDSFMCDMTHSYIWHELFVLMTRLVLMCDLTHSHVCRDSSMYTRMLHQIFQAPGPVLLLGIHLCGPLSIRAVEVFFFKFMNTNIDIWVWTLLFCNFKMSCMHMCIRICMLMGMYMNASYGSMGWLRLVGSSTWQVSFAK